MLRTAARMKAGIFMMSALMDGSGYGFKSKELRLCAGNGNGDERSGVLI